MNIKLTDQANALETQTNSAEGVTNHSKDQPITFQPGQTFTGEISQISGNDIQILLNQNKIIHALLDNNITFSVGQAVTFQVTSTSNHLLSLRPLYENLTKDPNLLKALMAANIPMNETSLKLVSLLMEQNMPIDKQSLYSLYKEVTSNPNSQMEDLVFLNKLKLPITPENLNQMNITRNFNQVMSGGIEVAMEGFQKTLMELTTTKGDLSPVEFLNKVLLVFSKDENGEGNLKQETNVSSKDITNTQTIFDVVNLKMEPSEQQLFDPSNIKNEENLEQKYSESKNELKNNEFQQILKQLGIKTESVMLLLDQGKDFEALKLIMDSFTLSKDPTIPNQLEQLFQHDTFQGMFKELFQKQWTLEPMEVSKQENVEELYQRIRYQSNQLNHQLESVLKEDNPFVKAVQNMKEHLEFVNQLNQTISYIQIPLKMHKQNSTGELYVYTNKKNLAKKDGVFTAHLHLDMDHLGPVDVKITLEKKKILNEFYLSSKELLDFIEINLPTLNERISQKGYQAQSKCFLEEKSKKIMNEILEENTSKNIISKYSFDMRA